MHGTCTCTYNVQQETYAVGGVQQCVCVCVSEDGLVFAGKIERNGLEVEGEEWVGRVSLPAKELLDELWQLAAIKQLTVRPATKHNG